MELCSEVRSLREVLTWQPVGVLVGTALPGSVCLGEEDIDAELRGGRPVTGHLDALVPGDRLEHASWQIAHPFPYRRMKSVAVSPGEVQKPDRPGGAFNERADR